MLAILALSNRKPVMRQRLTELLWSKRPTDLARASLRQEIHRLLDVLQPFGTEIIDIGRHTLTLRPNLTSVDVEDIYAGGLDVLDSTVEPEEMLFTDLNGIDPAFDLWLQSQRTRFCRHIQRLMTSEQASPDSPVRILSSLSPSDTGPMPGDAAPDTPSPIARTGQFHVPPNEPLFPGRSPWKNAAPALETLRRLSDPPETGAHPQNGEGEGESQPPPPLQKVRSLSLTLMPIETRDPSLKTVADELASQLNVLFVGSDAFTLVISHPPRDELDATADWIETLRGKQIDFLCTGILHSSVKGTEEHPALLLRLIDVQNGGEMIWTVRAALPSGTRQNPGLAVPLLARAVLSAQWAAVLRHARHLLKCSIQALAPDQLAARALITLLQAQHHALHEAETLLKFAEWLGPNQPLVAIARAVTEMTRANAFLQGDYAASVARALAAAQHAAVLSQHNISRNFLLAFVYCHIPGYADTADALLSPFKSNDEDTDQAWFAPYRALQALLALLKGRQETARNLLRHYRISGNAQPLSVAMDPCAVLYLFLADLPTEAIRIGRMVAALYPQLPSALVYHLVALTTEENSTERTDILARLSALDPTLTIRRVMASHPSLPAGARAKLAAALHLTGLPE
ncbi:AfsR/SARP family transcriptional regulator [Gluconacetobacter sp. Hr-1-5]|uniref:AfsR/SARP family transcriptional regulator n=1 Tax=Gluconacetobacter sp. Hr-1-5 TaxID=3395370 RepID=UPI003B51ADB2